MRASISCARLLDPPVVQPEAEPAARPLMNDVSNPYPATIVATGSSRAVKMFQAKATEPSAELPPPVTDTVPTFGPEHAQLRNARTSSNGVNVGRPTGIDDEDRPPQGWTTHCGRGC